jgi:two-component system, sensor histidine kinase PdtaS
MSFHHGSTIASAATRERPAAIGATRQAQQTRARAAGEALSKPVSSVTGTGITRQELRKALAETQKGAELYERRLAELNHRVANTLQIVSGLIRAQHDRLTEPSAKAALIAASVRVDAVAQLHRHLCRRGETQWVDLGRFIEEVAPAIEAATGLVCELDVEPFEVPDEAALHLAIAINELVLNARKHAYGGQDGGWVRISCRRDPDGRLRLSVADGGRGLPGGFDPRRTKGLGMEIVAATMRQFDSELHAEDDQGARFTMVLMFP